MKEPEKQSNLVSLFVARAWAKATGERMKVDEFLCFVLMELFQRLSHAWLARIERSPEGVIFIQRTPDCIHKSLDGLHNGPAWVGAPSGAWAWFLRTREMA